MPQRNGKVWIGIIFILFGIMFLLDNTNFFAFNLHHIFFSFPMFLIIIGVIIIVHTRNSLFGYIVLGIGILTLLPRMMPFMHIYFSDILPLIIIIIGLMILLRRKDYTHHPRNEQHGGPYHSHFDYSGDILNDSSIFYSSRKIVRSQNFKGGKITSFFGGSSIDFSQAKLAEGSNILDLAVIFGGVHFQVPSNWKVVINATTIFGGFEDKRYLTSPAAELSEGTLVISGFILFGGGKLENSLIN